MIPKNRIPAHPGKILVREFLQPMGITQKMLAEHLGISQQRVNGICRGKRSVTADTAWLLSDAFGTSPELWINLQARYDLATQRPGRHIEPIRSVA